MRDHSYCQELLGAYALDAVSDEERDEIERHLATCEECRAELARQRAATQARALGVGDVEPPGQLRRRIGEAALGDDEGGAIPALPTAARGEAGLGRRSTLIPWAAAAVLLIATLGLLVWNLQLREQVAEREGRTIALQPVATVDAAGQLTYYPDRQLTVLTTTDLPELEPDQVYQVWLIRDETPIPSGIFTQVGQPHAIAVDLEQYQAIAITIEPGPLGSPAPTSDPFVVTPLKGV